MKKICLSAILLFICSCKVLAQVPPPPPLIWAPPSESEIKEFISKEFGFKISFPGEPKIETKKSEDGFETLFKVYRNGSNSFVRVTDFKERLKKYQEQMIQSYRELILNTPPPYIGAKVSKPEIISESEFTVGKYKGIEFVYKFDLRFAKVRLLFVEKRTYEIKLDITNWHILNDHYKEKVEAFNKETERFFNSFQLIKK